MPFAEMKPVQVQFWEIKVYTDLQPALDWAKKSFGFYGVITVNQDGDWWLSITRPLEERHTRIDARAGEVLVWNGMTMTTLTQEAFDQTHNIS